MLLAINNVAQDNVAVDLRQPVFYRDVWNLLSPNAFEDNFLNPNVWPTRGRDIKDACGVLLVHHTSLRPVPGSTGGNIAGSGVINGGRSPIPGGENELSKTCAYHNGHSFRRMC